MDDATSEGAGARAADEVPARALYGTYAAGLTANSVTMMLKVVVPLWALHLNMSPTMIGVAIGAAAVLPLILAIHGGVLMDRLGTRRVTLFFAFLTTVLIPLYPAMPLFGAVVILQMLTGLTTNLNWMGVQTLICQFTKGDTAAIGRFSFWSRLGLLGAPILIGVIWDLFGPWGAFLVTGACGGLTLAALFLMGDTRPVSKAPALGAGALTPRLSDYAKAFALISIPAVAFIVVATFLRISSSGIQTSFYVVYLDGIGLTGTLIGVLIAASEFSGSFGALLAGPMVKIMRPHWVLLLFAAASIFFISITPVLGGILVLLFIASALRGGCQGLSQPVMFSILSRAVGANEQGMSIGLRTTANRLATMIVPVIMGALADTIGLEASFIIVGGFLVLSCALLGLIIRRIPGFST
ncbi:MAG: MFS transporter [Proteobacteria bacterium]|nr:MFS transporter [Pseudomonadota bacterium]